MTNKEYQKTLNFIKKQFTHKAGTVQYSVFLHINKRTLKLLDSKPAFARLSTYYNVIEVTNARFNKQGSSFRVSYPKYKTPSENKEIFNDVYFDGIHKRDIVTFMKLKYKCR